MPGQGLVVEPQNPTFSSFSPSLECLLFMALCMLDIPSGFNYVWPFSNAKEYFLLEKYVIFNIDFNV